MHSLRSQSGQGVLEYVLILVVVVAIILGVTLQFNEAFAGWARNYFGEYLSCLLETGELPNLSDGSVAGACDESFQKFSFASGRPRIDGAGGGNSDASSEDEEEGAGKTSAASNNEGSSQGVGGSRSQSGDNYIPLSQGRSSSRDQDRGSSSGPGKEQYTGSTEANAPSTKSQDYGGTERIPLNNYAGYGYGTAYNQDDDKDERIKTASKELDTKGKQDERMKLNRKPAAPEDPGDDGLQWTFGNFLRYLIIAAIIIALVVFLGGQAVQISKSME